MGFSSHQSRHACAVLIFVLATAPLPWDGAKAGAPEARMPAARAAPQAVQRAPVVPLPPDTPAAPRDTRYDTPGMVAEPLPVPLRLAEVVRIARERRAEVTAAVARASAAAQRPAIVSALEDPMIAPAIDHYPFEAMDDAESGRRFDWSIAVEQRFPLSNARAQRRRAAQADARRSEADADRVRLDVALEAQRAFFMLRERREMRRVLEEQLSLSRQLVAAATARYAGAKGAQADVLRAEVEVARTQAAIRSLAAQTSAAEAMLNVTLARSPSLPVPDLEYQVRFDEPPAAERVQAAAIESRPELRAGAAEVARAGAEIDVMRSMYRPMMTIRGGPSSTMAEGTGAMIMIGVSIPIWRDRLQAGVAEASAMERMARADLEAMRRMIEGEAVVAREGVNASRATAEALRKEVVPRARMAVESALAAYSAGRVTLVTVIESSRALWEARSELVMADRVLAEAWARLERAVASTQQGAP
jgi:cobalt-zinc-cadmium efflux system outer membrane protein